jgi:hypothetical protein
MRALGTLIGPLALVIRKPKMGHSQAPINYPS